MNYNLGDSIQVFDQVKDAYKEMGRDDTATIIIFSLYLITTLAFIIYAMIKLKSSSNQSLADRQTHKKSVDSIVENCKKEVRSLVEHNMGLMDDKYNQMVNLEGYIAMNIKNVTTSIGVIVDDVKNYQSDLVARATKRGHQIVSKFDVISGQLLSEHRLHHSSEKEVWADRHAIEELIDSMMSYHVRLKVDYCAKVIRLNSINGREMNKLKKRWDLLIILFMITMLFSGCTDTNNDNQNKEDMSFNFDDDWTTEIVDDSGWVGIDPIIAVDSDNKPHIAYYDQGNRDLKYAYYNGAGWNIETVDSDGDVGEEPGIDIDLDGNPHISYQDHTGRSLKYATKKDEAWVITKVDSLHLEIQGLSTSLKLDTNGNPHIAYIFSTKDVDNEPDNENKVRYAYYNGIEWAVEEIRRLGMDIMLDLDSNNIPHVCFRIEIDNTERICYATKINDIQTIETVDEGTHAGGDTSIDVDSDNVIHIVYNDYDNCGIKYAKKQDTIWEIKTVDTNVGCQEGLKLSVDAGNIPHIIYSAEDEDDGEGISKLIYAYIDGTIWVKETVTWMGNPAIKIDSLP